MARRLWSLKTGESMLPLMLSLCGEVIGSYIVEGRHDESFDHRPVTPKVLKLDFGTIVI